MSGGGRQKSQSPLWIARNELARGPSHQFYDTLNILLPEARFDRHTEALCAPHSDAGHVPARHSGPPPHLFPHAPRQLL